MFLVLRSGRVRRFSTAVPRRASSQSSTSPHSPSNPHIPSLHRKQIFDPRPPPIKPKTSTLSATFRPIKSTQPIPRPTSDTSSLGIVKETAKRDIRDAEAHGILTPPPPDANWFKKTLHKGIQLAVGWSSFYLVLFVLTFDLEILLCGRETHFYPTETNISYSSTHQGRR